MLTCQSDNGRFDLPIALGILAASGQLPASRLAGYEFAGELSLSGELRPVRGALAMMLQASGDGRCFILPAASAAEASLCGQGNLLAARSLLEVCAHINGAQQLSAPETDAARREAVFPDLADVRGQHQARRALEIAAAGRHSLLLSGPPGTGKSMLASRLPSLLPPLSEEEARASAAILSLTSQFDPGRYGTRVYRQPHHTTSAAALVGGGNPPRPGEISLAHHGVLFLDELPEFDRKVLETLREPLESGRIHIARAGRQADFPAAFQLVAAMNPCPCGHLGQARCRCTPDQVTRYRHKLSGPLLDRIDIFVDVPPLPATTLAATADGEDSATVRARVSRAWIEQQRRQGKANAHLAGREIDQFCALDDAGMRLLQQAAERLQLSARAWHRIQRLARTIADLAASETILPSHLREAIQYRRFTTDIHA